MHLRWIQLPFRPERGGFDDAPLTEVLRDQNVLDAREYFFEHGGRPYLGCFIVLDGEARVPASVTKPTPRPPRAARARGSEDESSSESAGAPDLDAPDLDATGLRAAAELRRWRSRRAKELGMPAYRLLPNRTLDALARMRPMTQATLLEVTGIGAARASAHGDELLACLRSAEAGGLLDSLPLPTAAD